MLSWWKEGRSATCRGTAWREKGKAVGEQGIRYERLKQLLRTRTRAFSGLMTAVVPRTKGRVTRHHRAIRTPVKRRDDTKSGAITDRD